MAADATKYARFAEGLLFEAPSSTCRGVCSNGFTCKPHAKITRFFAAAKRDDPGGPELPPAPGQALIEYKQRSAAQRRHRAWAVTLCAVHFH